MCLFISLFVAAGPIIEKIEIEVQVGEKAAEKIIKVINLSEEEEILEDKNVLMKLKKILVPGLKNSTSSSSSSSRSLSSRSSSSSSKLRSSSSASSKSSSSSSSRQRSKMVDVATLRSKASKRLSSSASSSRSSSSSVRSSSASSSRSSVKSSSRSSSSSSRSSSLSRVRHKFTTENVRNSRTIKYVHGLMC